jgi:hypothetical protein
VTDNRIEIDYDEADITRDDTLSRVNDVIDAIKGFIKLIEFTFIGPQYHLEITSTPPARLWTQDLKINSAGHVENYVVPDYWSESETGKIRACVALLADGVRAHKVTRFELEIGV